MAYNVCKILPSTSSLDKPRFFFFTIRFGDREPKRVIVCRYITSNAHVIAEHEGNGPVIVNGLTSPIIFFDTTNTATRSTCVCRIVIYE